MSFRREQREAEERWRRIAAGAGPPTEAFDPGMLDGQPEIAQRYFRYAIAPGTPLRRAVQLDMHGTFLLGDKNSFQTYAMRARQILHPPSQFVWIADLRSGAMRISGSDGLMEGSAWTRFWLMGLIPVAKARSSPDLVRSATFRSTVESIWAPANLLPQNGVVWEQTGDNAARLRFESVAPQIHLDLILGREGALREVVGQRWSNANPAKVFRPQPFGGTIQDHAQFGGYRIPSRLAVGNHFGTEDYLPFFQARISKAVFL